MKPDDEMATINMADAYRSPGMDDEALGGYRRFLRRAPELEPKMAAAQNALGVIAFRRGDVALAQREIQKALDQKPDVRLAHFNLALIAEERRERRRGRPWKSPEKGTLKAFSTGVQKEKVSVPFSRC